MWLLLYATRLMPSAPKPACSKCRRKHCDDPTHKRPPRERTPRRTPRHVSWQERKRRKREVDAFTAANCIDVNDEGKRVCYCPACGNMAVSFVADHITPWIEGGDEDGPLRVTCSTCSHRQGARLSNPRGRARLEPPRP